MKILYITPNNPLDKGYGAAVRSKALLDALRKIGEVKTLVVSRFEPIKTGDEASNNISFPPFYSLYCRSLKWSLFIAIATLVKSLNWGFPDRRRIAERLGIAVDDYDIVVVRYLFCAAKLGGWERGKCIIDVDDNPVAHVNTEVIPKVPYWARKIVRLLYVAFLHLICRKVSGLFVSNSVDTCALMPYNKNTTYLHNRSLDPEVGSYCILSSEFYVLCVASLRYSPNYMGIDRFLDEEWPIIKLRFPTMAFKIAGRWLPEQYREKWSRIDGVELLGFVEDLSNLYAKSLAVVVPLWAGGGTSVKTIEALKYGCKVIATPVGARGLTDEQLSLYQVDVACRKGDFAHWIELWEQYSPNDQLKIRESIMQFARDLNSKESFDKTVKNMVMSVTGERCLK